MDAIYASGVVAVLALALLVIYVMTGKKDSQDDPDDLALLGGTATDSDAHAWISELHRDGIWAEIRERGEQVTGDLAVIEPPSSAWHYEVWVRASDLDRAREVLGLRSGDLN